MCCFGKLGGQSAPKCSQLGCSFANMQANPLLISGAPDSSFSSNETDGLLHFLVGTRENGAQHLSKREEDVFSTLFDIRISPFCWKRTPAQVFQSSRIRPKS
ncbi:hypothetical protein Y032_0011g1528 [Ancylostoma ceylanicum]|uniref:Uncharacterized protein n=1 Tax=Ancylostoma ceylanicum TaxID=53326 RepID=A0A016VFK2_9BILA|nr:hypothetical protein Y032_0011g1528 [Ancylostoma ceylanicum]